MTMPALTTFPKQQVSLFSAPGMAPFIGGIPMSEIMTTTGLRLPEHFTEEEFFAAGQFLSRVEKGTQWAIGDWYNAIPWGDKEAACERAGLNFRTAITYGGIAAKFQMSMRIDNCPFFHYQKLAVDALTPDQRTALLEQSAKNRWSAPRLVKERDRLLGRDDRVPLLTFDGKVQRLIETLPPTATKKTKAALSQVVNDLRHDFETEVEHVVRERLKDQRERLTAREKEVLAERERVRELRTNLDGLMTEEEYRLVRGCLHPDRAPEDRRQQFGKAFDIFTRLEKSVNRDMPIKLRRQHGWS